MAAPTLSPDELQRYGRHLTLPEVGREGQEKLKASSVLVVGAGGLGSPLAMYLAAAGVGRLGLVDSDRVEASNLQRQVLYGEADVGRPKLDAAAERLHAINPHVTVERHAARLTSDNALEIIRGGYDLVADGTDNFPTRYLVNDACVMAGVPNVYASVFRFEGQVSVFGAEGGPCYRCLYPEPPPPGQVPSCAEGGVLGVLPGIVGSMQATEAIKLLLEIGAPLVGRLLLFDALRADARTVRFDKNPDCPVCSAHPTVTELIDYEAFCGVGSSSPHSENTAMNSSAGSQNEQVPETTVQDYQARREAGDAPFLLDVRKPREYEITNLGGTLIPLDELPNRLDELEAHRGEEIVVHCRTGGRSARATQFLRRQGFDAENLKGGIHAWSDEVDASVPKY